MSIYLAVDLGTTGCRSILFDQSLHIVGSSYQEYGLIMPQDGFVEQDAELWWKLTLDTAKGAIQNAGIRPTDVVAISISSQGISFVPVDREYRPLYHAISWLDTRATNQTAQLSEDLGDENIFLHTGKPNDACYTLPKLMWFQENHPDVFAQTYKFLMPMDYLIAKFTGNCVTDHSMASGTLMYDIRNCCWSNGILDKYNVPIEKLPQIAYSGTCAGKVTAEVCLELGLSPDCVVAVGAQDQKCAALGAGLQTGTLTLSLGTAGAITKLWDAPCIEQCTKVGWCGYTRPGAWVTEGVINTAGTCLRWVRDIFFPGEDYDTINKEAKDALEQGASLLFYPYMNGPSGPEFYPDAQGVFYGMHLGTKRGHFAAAVMEGIAFQTRILLEAMDENGSQQHMVLFGGGAKSPLWCQIIADITGRTIHVPETEEAAGAGAAILAANACGVTLSGLPISKTYEPSSHRLAYEEKYLNYRKIEKKLWQEG